MGLHAAETLGDPSAYRFTDPDAFLACDNPHCDAPWVTRSGLVAWPIEAGSASASRFTDRLLVACSQACLDAARAALAHTRVRWSPPLPVASWLAALAASLDRDPATTPIGEFAGAAGQAAPVSRRMSTASALETASAMDEGPRYGTQACACRETHTKPTESSGLVGNPLGR